MSNRKFEVVKGFEGKDINLPKRATKNAAGYDFEAAETIELPSMLEDFATRLLKHTPQRLEHIGRESIEFPEEFYTDEHEFAAIKPTLVPTGIKASMGVDEALPLYNRSSNPKRGLYLANGVGLVDSDYFGNPDNDGHIFFAFINLTPHAITIKKGERIGQGVFQKFLIVDDEDEVTTVRTGGHGSTGI